MQKQAELRVGAGREQGRAGTGAGQDGAGKDRKGTGRIWQARKGPG